MRSPRYPLEPLAQQRARRVDDAVSGLARAISEREAAEQRRAASERSRAAHDAHVEQVRAREQAALEQGGLRAADLAQAHAFQVGAGAQRAALVAAEGKARDAAHQAGETERQAQGEVAARKADAEVVARDRARWVAGAKSRAEAADEEAAAEAFRPAR